MPTPTAPPTEGEFEKEMNELERIINLACKTNRSGYFVAKKNPRTVALLVNFLSALDRYCVKRLNQTDVVVPMDKI